MEAKKYTRSKWTERLIADCSFIRMTLWLLWLYLRSDVPGERPSRYGCKLEAKKPISLFFFWEARPRNTRSKWTERLIADVRLYAWPFNCCPYIWRGNVSGERPSRYGCKLEAKKPISLFFFWEEMQGPNDQIVSLQIVLLSECPFNCCHYIWRVMCLVSDHHVTDANWKPRNPSLCSFSERKYKVLLSGKMELPGVFSCECSFNCCPYIWGVMCLVSDPWSGPGVRSLLSGKMELPGVFSCECPFNGCHYIWRGDVPGKRPLGRPGVQIVRFSATSILVRVSL